jgi:hypothetical protein
MNIPAHWLQQGAAHTSHAPTDYGSLSLYAKVALAFDFGWRSGSPLR